ncbi:MAG TPA: hypothetical protein VN936_05850 [Candidatus Acidoferrum sp.]|nr:hypothetical protein [Candidatus Acidoferrum sp.]
MRHLLFIAVAVSIAAVACSPSSEGSSGFVSASDATKARNLYVGGAGYVAVFAPGQTQPLRVITDKVWFVNSLPFDSNGNLYVFGSPLDKSIRVYPPGATKPVRKITIGIESPLFLAMDPNNNLYLSEQSPTRTVVYPYGQSRPSYKIREFGFQLLFDSKGYLYMSNNGNIYEYPPGATEPSEVLNLGAGYTLTQIALDSNDDLYASVGESGQIEKFAPRSKTLLGVVVQEAPLPKEILVDSKGHIFCACEKSVNEYSSTGMLVRTITDGLDGALALQVDSSGTLYVANYNNGTVTEYLPGSKSVYQTISNVADVSALAFGP